MQPQSTSNINSYPASGKFIAHILQQALIEGEESGDDGELDMAEIKREARQEAQLEGLDV